MSREATGDTAWCAACRRDVTLDSAGQMPMPVPGIGMDEFCPGSWDAPHAVEAEHAVRRDRDL